VLPFGIKFAQANDGKNPVSMSWEEVLLKAMPSRDG
jgi:hypothetical protein